MKHRTITKKRINKNKWYFEKLRKIEKFLIRLTKKKMQLTKNYQQLYANKLDSLDDMENS